MYINTTIDDKLIHQARQLSGGQTTTSLTHGAQEREKHRSIRYERGDIMKPAVLAPKLAFVVTQRGLDEATILALAVSKGIQLLYQEAVTEAYLLGQLSREQALTELGPNILADLEYQREALKRDVEWGLADD